MNHVNQVNMVHTPKQHGIGPPNPLNTTPLHNAFNNAPATPLQNVPSLPALIPNASVGSLLSFRGLSDPLTTLASGLPRMDSTGLFLPTVHRENSIPQVPTTPNIQRNLSELSLLSQGNSHFVPYNAAGFFESTYTVTDGQCTVRPTY
eukprot:TRINITY_DN19655_c0_g1_i1.p1 TRINITY_DN19655_c0_g1~~TRINITY_DN19655_c0_g1_i1.p1  ORF type:complete len:159 (-),score=2.53 TRINITY_DN19655_c0_g1_i1:117-560(-)